MCIVFFKQKTAYEMRISDWSSDVCSSDLLLRQDLLVGLQAERLLVLRRYALVDQHRLTGQRIGRAVGDIVVGAVGDERHQDQQARAEAEPATPARPGVLASERIATHLLLLPSCYILRTTRKPIRPMVLSTPARSEMNTSAI